MLYQVLKNKEDDITNNIDLNLQKLDTIKRMIDLVGEIDFKVEYVPITNYDRLYRLLTSLKKTALSQGEIDMIKEITNS